jgi:XTP/dITP diphosphohydrolase
MRCAIGVRIHQANIRARRVRAATDSESSLGREQNSQTKAMEQKTMKKLVVVTGNANKAKEIAAITGFPTENIELDIKEIQSLSVAEVAREKARAAFAQLKRPVLVDDTGMSISALGGLPGALVSWFLDTIGPEGILRLLGESSDRSATVSTCVAYCDGDRVEVFEGAVKGTISNDLRGTNGFGYDPIFIPERSSKTYAEMSSDEKNAASMRSIALGKLKEFLQTEQHSGA